MNRKPLEFISGLALFVVISLFIGWGVILRLPFIPPSLIEWLGGSRDPQRALFYFSALASATLLILVGFGVEIPKLKAYVSASERARRYLTGLPLWALVRILAASQAGFWAVFPSCQPPATVIFEAAGRERTYQPSESLTVSPGETLAVAARPANPGATLSCAWEYAGPVFDTPGAQRGCQVNIHFSGEPGEGFLTVVVSENFCSQTSIFNLRTIVQP